VLTRLQAHAAQRARFGYRRLHILLEREGLLVNHKRVHRIYRAAGLQVRRRRRKRLTRADRVPLPMPSQRLARWSMDFTADTLADGRGFRTSTTSPASVSPSKSIARCLGSASPVCSIAYTAWSDSRRRSSSTTGPEFAGRTLDAWAYTRGVELRFIRPGKPIENAYVESFNGTFRDECLNEHWFVSLADAKTAIESWRVDYNTVRPHSSLAGRTPNQFAALSVGARRLMPARPDKGLKPEDLALSV
jgi:putative transposase